MTGMAMRSAPAEGPATLLTMRPHRSRAAIIAAARSLYRERPADGVSMELIALRAGVTRRTVYNQFADAADLYRATREALIFEIVGLLPSGLAFDLPPRAALRSYCGLVAQAFLDPRYVELAGSIVRDGWANPWLAEAYQRHIRVPIAHSLQFYLQGLRPGAATSGGDLRRLALNLLAAIESASVATRLLPALDGEPPDCTPDLIDAFLTRLCPPAAPCARPA